jgi:hypothetical protein
MHRSARAGAYAERDCTALEARTGVQLDPSYLNAVEHDHRYTPEDYLIQQMAKIVGISPDVLYFTRTASRLT